MPTRGQQDQARVGQPETELAVLTVDGRSLPLARESPALTTLTVPTVRQAGVRQCLNGHPSPAASWPVVTSAAIMSVEYALTGRESRRGESYTPVRGHRSTLSDVDTEAERPAGELAGPEVVPPWRPAGSPPDRIVAAACLLFDRSGVRGVHVDAIMETAGVGRNTFYRHFRSKDLLL